MTARLEELAATGGYSSLDLAFARAVARRADSPGDAVALAAAAVSRAAAEALVRLDLGHLAGRPLDESAPFGARWPEPSEWLAALAASPADRKSTRLNSSHYS